jgi:hypothetical protein
MARPLAGMPPGSVFPSVKEAYDFLVDLYDAFAYDTESAEVFLLQIERGDWDIRIFEPLDHYLGYLSAGPFPAGSAALDSIFYIRNVPYRWLPLLKEKIKHRPGTARRDSLPHGFGVVRRSAERLGPVPSGPKKLPN